MELSKRLSAVAGLVTTGYRLADIGTDHAYIPIYLVRKGRVPLAVAMDINRGPLLRAKENIRAWGYEDRIATRISNGFEALGEEEADAAVIAGMGGGLMTRILKDGSRVVRSLKECVLQPQSETEKVRTFLLEEGFCFTEETMVEEDGKYYPVMKVTPPPAGNGEDAESRPGGKSEWTETEKRYGKLLLCGRNPVLKEYLEREIRIRKRILKELEKENSRRTVQRMRELRDEMEHARKGLEYYVVQ
nr:class I SAM-dependent methyltransferase [uncultured Mediterraneibacter sp.]